MRVDRRNGSGLIITASMMLKTETVAQRQNNGRTKPSIFPQPAECLTNLAEVHSQALNTLTTPGFEAMVRISSSLSRSMPQDV